MANAAIAYDNTALADGASVRVDGALVTAPATNLLNPHVAKKCRVNADSMLVVIDQGASLPFDTALLAGLANSNGSAANPTFRVRGSSADASGVAGDVFDSGSLNGLPYFDVRFGKFVYLRAAPLNARYISILVSEAGATYNDAGLAFSGVREAFGVNFQPPWGTTPVRASEDTMGVGGQTFVDLRAGHWEQSVSFGFLSEAERTGFLREMGARVVNDGHLDYLWIPDPDSDNLSADCIWGYSAGNPALTQDLVVVPPVFGVTFNVRQRR